MTVRDQPDIGIAVQQQRRRRPLEQAIRPHQLDHRFLAEDRQRSDKPGHQPHRAQAHRVAPINLVQLRFIAAREAAAFALALQPGRHERPHLRSALAPEPKRHGNSWISVIPAKAGISFLWAPRPQLSLG